MVEWRLDSSVEAAGERIGGEALSWSFDPSLRLESRLGAGHSKSLRTVLRDLSASRGNGSVPEGNHGVDGMDETAMNGEIRHVSHGEY